MAPRIEAFYQEYGAIALIPGKRQSGLASLVLPPIQEVQPGVEVYGVPIYSWGSDVDGFRRSTGITFPIAENPGLPVSTSRHPVTVFYNKLTKVHRVAAVGVVSNAELKNQFVDFSEGRPRSQATGSS